MVHQVVAAFGDSFTDPPRTVVGFKESPVLGKTNFDFSQRAASLANDGADFEVRRRHVFDNGAEGIDTPFFERREFAYQVAAAGISIRLVEGIPEVDVSAQGG